MCTTWSPPLVMAYTTNNVNQYMACTLAAGWSAGILNLITYTDKFSCSCPFHIIPDSLYCLEPAFFLLSSLRALALVVVFLTKITTKNHHSISFNFTYVYEGLISHWLLSPLLRHILRKYTNMLYSYLSIGTECFPLDSFQIVRMCTYVYIRFGLQLTWQCGPDTTAVESPWGLEQFYTWKLQICICINFLSKIFCTECLYIGMRHRKSGLCSTVLMIAYIQGYFIIKRADIWMCWRIL